MKEIIDEEPGFPHLRWTKEHGSIVHYRGILGRDKILISDPSALKRVMVDNNRNYIKPPRLTKMLSEVVGRGLLTTEGDEHSWQRKLLSPLFHFTNMKALLPIMQNKAVELLRRWQKAAGEGGELKIERELAAYTMDVIGLAGFDYDFNALALGKDSKMYSVFKAISPGLDILGAIFPFLRSIPTARNKERWEGLRILRSAVEDIITNKAQATAKRSEPKTTRDLLDIMMAAEDSTGRRMTEAEMTDNVLTFMVAGHETTATLLTWAFYALDKNPRVQDKLRAELMDAFGGDAEREVTWEELKSLSYLEAFFQELLRRYPPVPVTSRLPLRDDELCGYHVPAGTPVFICPYAIHHNDKVWPDPFDFRPERFIEKPRPAPYTLLPFLAGDRSCIGSRFAMMEAKMALITLLPHLRMRCAPDVVTRTTLRVTLKPKPDLMMQPELVEA
eukprot:PLAT8822.1.p1 GENE.PLAT8822.1~~PLAT8822.1.p1  ORF type:complete len:492 (-),score=157.76 PLAT8822.1:81-1418(-)